ncbi:gluzincin family metallopeptidase [Cytobacillus dafuensis]|uniref:Peptidase MA-like domain-containing protein n=1 Tax=Cytobacillus dafuensis TaxID=1742359 RepID=A0A5B8Z1E6_CYTDA|nr:hypothetical protein [Cytobacillus dafuensis]QED46063.1 hypothetical protein FSZ17_01370 [Cytobacillus dafuensis]
MNRLTYAILCILVLTACSNETTVPKKKNSPNENTYTEKTEENIVITKDKKITFEIFNTIGVPQQKVDSIKEEILSSYEVVHQSIKPDYVPSEKINVFLLEGNQVSWGLRSEIKLYSIRTNKYPLVHEMTHTLLGYGDNFDSSKGYFTQEGYATFMENKYGKQSYPEHKMMKYFIDNNKAIPLFKLIDVNKDDELFRPTLLDYKDYTLQWISYTHSGSFVTYLIDTYGIEKFEQIYNKDNLLERLQKVYGKTVDELENDWLNYIQQYVTELTTEDKMKIDGFYDMNSAIGLIDIDVFKR